MRLTVLASGSKGNSAVVATDRTRILVDAGLSCRELLKRMHAAREDPARLSAILITHEHQDHVAGLGVLARRLRIPVFFTEPTHRAWIRMLTPRTTMSYAQWLDKLAREREERAAAAHAHVPEYSFAPSLSQVPAAQVAPAQTSAAQVAPAQTSAAQTSAAQTQTDPAKLEAIARISAEAAALDPHVLEPLAPAEVLVEEPCEPRSSARSASTGGFDPTALPAVEYFHAGTRFSIGDIDICPFTIPHDAADPCGFVFSAAGVRFGLATDLGYLPPNVKAALRDLDLILLESNHDLEMLRDGPYPWSVKQRVLSRVGHLSNLACAEFLERDYDGGAHTIVLAHISASNNVPELARLAAEQAIGDRMRLLGNHVVVAGQDLPLEPITL